MTNPNTTADSEDAVAVRGLEAKYFTDPDLYQRIIDRVFLKHWQLACHASQVANPGDFITLTIGDQDVLVTHAHGGGFKAFYNVCQHRGHILAAGNGNKKLLVCPYHAWSYDLQGRLQAAPHSQQVPGFNKSDICLTEIRLENFLGFLFVNLDPDCANLDQCFPGIRAEMLALCPDLERRQLVYQHTVDEACNWLVAVENYNECYHCGHCHPSFAKGVIDPESYSILPYGDLQVLHHSSEASHSDEAWYDVGGASYGSFFLWPATSIQFYPGGMVNSFAWHPLAVDDVRVIRGFYSNDGQVDATLEQIIENDRATTFQEDLDIVKAVQRGLNSRGYNPGPLILNPAGGINNELPLQNLHQWLRAAVD